MNSRPCMENLLCVFHEYSIQYLFIYLLSILSKDMESTKGKPVRGAPQLIIHTYTDANTAQVQTIH